MKCAWIAGQREAYPLPAMWTAPGLSSSGYRAWTRGGRTNGKRLSNARLLALIRPLRAELEGAYGLRAWSARSVGGVSRRARNGWSGSLLKRNDSQLAR